MSGSSLPSTRRGLAAAALLGAAALASLLSSAPGWAQAVTVAIVSPAQEETVYDNLGNVPVTVSIKGEAPAGARVRALLDGRPHGPDRPPGPFTLTGVERGEHALQVQLLDAKGGVTASSDIVKFTLWQASRLLPAQKP